MPPFILTLAERGLFPDSVMRWGIRQLLKQRLRQIRTGDVETAAQRELRFIEEISRAPIAVVPEKANEQHYEVPAEFFALVLGAHRKYSCCWWDDSTTSLAPHTLAHKGGPAQQHPRAA